MKILIANGYVRENKGDAALISVLSAQLQTAFPDAELSIASIEDPNVHPDFYGVKNVGSLQLYAAGVGMGRPRRLLRKLFVAGAGSVWPLIPFRKTFTQWMPSGMQGELSAIENADLVVAASGGYLSGGDSLSENLNLYIIALPFRLAERMKKMTVFAPQSFGPFENNWQQRLARATLNDAHLVFVRESKSYELLKSIGVREGRMLKAVDSGFAHNVSVSSVAPQKTEGMRIGITARDWLKGAAQKKYESALADFIVFAERNYGAQTVLIPQVTADYNADDDRIVEKRIKDLADQAGAHPLQVTDDMDHYDIKKLYASCDFTVGTRFHSVIFSLTSYVPAIAIEYEHKTSGIMHDLELDAWVLKIEDVTAEKLIALFGRIIIEQNDYRTHLTKVLPPYIARTDEVPQHIKEAYNHSIA